MANYHFTDSTKTPAYYEKKYCSKPLRYDNKHEKKSSSSHGTHIPARYRYN